MRHIRSAFLTTAALIASAGMAAAVTPSTNVDVSALQGFVLNAPILSNDTRGLRVHGSVCRATQVAPRALAVRLDRLDAQGAVVATETTMISGALSRRSRGCAFYTARTDWNMLLGESLRVTGLTARDVKP
jgi:hypothetical protein